MEDIVFARYVGGFGLVRNVAPKEYLAARPDAVAAFSGPVCGHMNADHESDTIAMVHKYVGMKVGGAPRGVLSEAVPCGGAGGGAEWARRCH